MGEIGQIYVQNVPDKNFDVSRITDFELVKDRIIAKVICMENNEKLLEGKPYRQMADLAVTYHVLLSKGDNDLAVKILNQSVDHCWQGLFALKDNEPHSANKGAIDWDNV